MKEQSLSAYLRQLASESSTPGGGSVGGSLGAHAAALMAMVNQLSAKKPEIDSRLGAFTNRLLDLAEADIAAFKKVSEAYQIDKSRSEERKSAIQLALRQCTEVPCQLAETAAELAVFFDEHIDQINTNVLSDAAIAMEVLKCTLATSEWNLRINFKFLKDTDFKKEILERYRTAKASIQRVTSQHLAKFELELPEL